MPGTSGNRGLANLIGRTAHSITLALILAIPQAASLARADDERPDLEIKLRGLDGQSDVKLLIINDSESWASETTVTVKTVTPGSANPKTLFVESLDPGETTSVTYVLAADCDGHEIEAEIATAKNRAGVAENKLGNNRLSSTRVCPPKAGAPKPEAKPEPPKPEPKVEPPNPEQPKSTGGLLETGPRGGPIVSTDTGVVVKSVPADLVVAEHLKPGTHTLDFKPSELVSIGNSKYYNTVPEVTPNPQPIGWTPIHGDRAREPLIVGWAQNEDNWIYPRFRAYQVLMRFDLEQLDEVPAKIVSRAAITFDEDPEEWSNEEGGGESKTGCAASLGRFRFNTDFNSVRGLIETEYVNDIPEGGNDTNVLRQILGREVAVTQHLLGYVQYPAFFTYQPNFVLRPELDDGEADDNEACLSSVFNIHLHVTYTVPSS